jgi:outer membrane protein OmpA-like peptidoglycan-associated protein
MKKKILLFSAIGLLSIGSIAAQTDYSRWSLAIKGGVNYFRIDAPISTWEPGTSSSSYYLNQAGLTLPVLQVEYTATPYYGIGLEAGLYQFKRYNLTGSTIDLVLNSSVNLSNFFSPLRRGFWRKGTFYGNFGMGLGFFSNDPKGISKETDFSPVVTTGVNFDYNFTPFLALILEGQYRIYTYDALGGTSPSTGNDDAFLANIGLRFKFGAKSKTHTRNAEVKDYYAELYGGEAVVAAQKAADDAAAAKKAVDSLANDTENRFNKLGNALMDKLNKFENDLRKLNDKPKDNSGTVNMWLDNVEFMFNSSVLTPEAKGILDEVANVLKNNAANNNVVVAGHSDDIGTEEYNQTLSVERANSVIKYLKEKGVTANLTGKGYGKSRPIADNTTAAGRQKNRRVEFQISK